MSAQANLERGYRRLLAWYPRAFRRENGQEILAVLLAGAADGQRRPGLAQSADLIRSGLRMRLRRRVPGSAGTVRAAVRIMYAGAAVSTVYLILLLALIGDIKVRHATPGHHLTAAEVSTLNPLVITQFTASGLALTALWLWMARANGQGRNWARSLSAVLFGLATLNLAAFGTPGIRESLVPMAFGPILPVLTWLAGLAAMWQLWRPASTAYFKPPGFTHARRGA
jgi:hypothetical protein